MKLLFVTDNGFCQRGADAFYSGANVQHYKVATTYFDEISFIAKKNAFNETYIQMDAKYPVAFIPSLFSRHFLARKKELVRQIEKEIQTADIVMCFGINGLIASKIAKKYQKKTLVYVGGSYYDTLKNLGSTFRSLLAGGIEYLMKRMIFQADYVHYVDEYLLTAYPTNGKVLICPSVNISVQANHLAMRREKIQAKSIEEPMVIGLIGYTHNKIKGIHLAIQALAALPENYQLQVVGNGDHQWLVQLAEQYQVAQRVTFLGTLDREALFAWLHQIDLYVQPSRTEGMPRATIEAMSCACPTVTSNAGGLKSLTHPEYLVAIDSDKELATKIKQLTASKETMLEQAEYNFSQTEKYDEQQLDMLRSRFYATLLLDLNREIMNGKDA